jgi:membrane-bound lytic murein transglycosylase D
LTLLGPAVSAADPAEAGAASATAAQATAPVAAPAPIPATTPVAAPVATPAEAEPVADAPETGPQGKEIDQESAELEAVRAAERAVRVQEVPGLESRAAEAVEGLGLGSPLRQRLEEALGREVTAPQRETPDRIALLPEIDHGLSKLQAEYDIPIDVNEAVVGYVRFFQLPLVRPHYLKYLGRGHRYIPRYQQIMREEGVPEDTVFLAMIESGFANYAVSRAKAVGPWQFIAPTGKLYGLKQDFWIDERRDPEKAARAAARFLKELHQSTGDWRLAWAGYNAGLGTVQRAQARGYPDYWSMAAAKGRRALRAETKGYVPKLMAAAIIARHPEDFGFRPEEIEPERWPEYEETTIEEAAPLALLAAAAGVGEVELVDLNPELRRATTPPRPYRLKLPVRSGSTFAANWPSMKARIPVAIFEGHVVQRGETLSGIAARYGVALDGILALNPRLNPRALRPGTELVIPRVNASASAKASLKGAAPPAATERPAPAHPAAPASAPSTAPATTAGPATTSLPNAAAATTASALPPGGVWRVKQGDTLWSISRNTGLPLGELCRLNGIENPRRHRLQVGATLLVTSTRG